MLQPMLGVEELVDRVVERLDAAVDAGHCAAEAESPLKVPTELLCKNGAVAQMLTSEAVR